ncbi:MAG: sugar phosphate isomerase/epimerase [Armatimonadetes bacterium]|nr:sugar phosphate isomerase/epimerase [Armatimonadota bacterium]
MKFAVCNEVFGDLPLSEQFAVAAQLGFDGIEISPFTISTYVTDISSATRAEIRAMAADAGLAVAAIHWVLAKTEGFHVTHPDAAVRSRTVDYLRALVDFGVDIGAGAMVVGSPLQRKVLPEVTYAQAWGWFAEAMAAAGAHGSAADFKICIEPLCVEADNNFIFKAFEAAKMARQIGLPNVGVILDTYSASRTEEDVPAAIRETGKLLFHYHCNDLNKRAPGWGTTDFTPILRALLEIGFEGFCSIEVFDFSIEPREHVGRGLAHLRECLSGAQQVGPDA